MRPMTLKQARSLPKSAILVGMFIQENGLQPVGVMADACELSPSAVYAALRLLQIPGKHDHDLDHGENKGGVQVPGPAPATPPEPSGDPLVDALVAHGIFAGTAVKLLAAHGRERVERQLVYHQARVEVGFPFRKGPGAYLYNAIVGDYAPFAPAAPGFSEARRDAERREVEVRAAAAPPPSPAAEPPVRMSQAAAITTVRRGMRSPVAHARAAAFALATEYGLDLAALGIPTDTPPKEAASCS